MANKTPLEDATRVSIILSAISAAGPADSEGWSAEVNDLAAKITAMTAPDSDLSKVVNGVHNAKVFTGDVIGIRKEASSSRGIVTLKTGTTYTKPGLPEGYEEARTDVTYNPAGKRMANRLRSLIGHKVAVWVEVEEYKKEGAPGGKGQSRVIRHVEDLGLSTDQDAIDAKAAKDAAGR